MLIVKHSTHSDRKNKTKNSTLDLRTMKPNTKKKEKFCFTHCKVYIMSIMLFMSHVFLPYLNFTLIITQLTTLFLANHIFYFYLLNILTALQLQGLN